MPDKKATSNSQHDHNDRNRNDKVNQLRVADIAKYLVQSANMHKEEKTGNPEFSEDLRRFAKSLKPHARLSLAEFADAMRASAPAGRRNTPAQKTDANLPPNLESLPPAEVEKVLVNTNYAKVQLVELGARRFGIPRSQLARRGKSGVLESISVALANERSLDIIAQEARRSGEKRSS
ncbi:MAG: hypothetical protein ACR2P7_00015 [bacterium]